jgi:hypothetical protein
MIRIGRYNIAETLQSGACGQRGCYGGKLSRDKIETKQSYRWELIEKPGHDSLPPMVYCSTIVYFAPDAPMHFSNK